MQLSTGFNVMGRDHTRLGTGSCIAKKEGAESSQHLLCHAMAGLLPGT